VWPRLKGELWRSVCHGQRGAHGDDSRSGSNSRALLVISLGSLCLTSLSNQQSDSRRQIGGPRTYLSPVMWVAQRVTISSIAHDAFPSVARVGKGERISLADSRSLVLVSCILTSPHCPFALEFFATFQIPSTVHSNGVQPPRLSFLIGRRPQEAEATAWMVVIRV
jgi:hypothetical protein